MIFRYYPKYAIHAVIRSISRNDEGDVQSISSISSDGSMKFRHSVDFDKEDPKIETSMIPFIDNSHVDRRPKFRLQFKGTHHLKISVKDENKGEVTVAVHSCPPMYNFLNEHGKMMSYYTRKGRLTGNLQISSNFNSFSSIKIFGTVLMLRVSNPLRQKLSAAWARFASSLSRFQGLNRSYTSNIWIWRRIRRLDL